MKIPTIKLSFRDFLNLLTLGALFHGALELKSFLMQNFVEKDTKLKHQVNQALNGQVSFPKKKSKKPEKARSSK